MIFTLVVLVASCGPPPSSAVAYVPASRSADSALQAAIISKTSEEALPVFVDLITPSGIPQGSSPRSAIGPDPTWWDVPDELREALASASQVESPSRALAVPPGIQRVTSSELENAQTDLILFYWAFAEPILSDNGSQALVFYERRCGGLCSGGGVVWLTQADDQSWTLRSDIGLWLS